MGRCQRGCPRLGLHVTVRRVIRLCGPRAIYGSWWLPPFRLYCRWRHDAGFSLRSTSRRLPNLRQPRAARPPPQCEIADGHCHCAQSASARSADRFHAALAKKWRKDRKNSTITVLRKSMRVLAGKFIRRRNLGHSRRDDRGGRHSQHIQIGNPRVHRADQPRALPHHIDVISGADVARTFEAHPDIRVNGVGTARQKIAMHGKRFRWLHAPFAVYLRHVAEQRDLFLRRSAHPLASAGRSRPQTFFADRLVQILERRALHYADTKTCEGHGIERHKASPAITASALAHASTERAIGPIELMLYDNGKAPSVGMRWRLGL